MSTMSTHERIDAYLRDYVASGQSVGLSAAIVQDGTTVFSAGYGVQNQQTTQPVTPQTLFHIASVAKTMTSTAIMQLREQGKLDLDDPLIKHLPYFQVDDPRSDQITIRQCLSHTSGIGHPEDYGWDRPEFDDEALERHVRGLATHKLVEIAPNSLAYSDIAYNVLGDLIAKVTGVSYVHNGEMNPNHCQRFQVSCGDKGADINDSKTYFNHSVFLLSVFSLLNVQRLNTDRRNTEDIHRAST